MVSINVGYNGGADLRFAEVSRFADMLGEIIR